jgi:hypothetical protein
MVPHFTLCPVLELKLVTPSPYSLTIYFNTAFPFTPNYRQLFRTFTFLYRNFSRISFFPYLLYGSDYSIARDLFAIITNSNEDKMRDFLLRRRVHYHLIAYFLGHNVFLGTTFSP